MMASIAQANPDHLKAIMWDLQDEYGIVGVTLSNGFHSSIYVASKVAAKAGDYSNANDYTWPGVMELSFGVLAATHDNSRIGKDLNAAVKDAQYALEAVYREAVGRVPYIHDAGHESIYKEDALNPIDPKTKRLSAVRFPTTRETLLSTAC